MVRRQTAWITVGLAGLLGMLSQRCATDGVQPSPGNHAFDVTAAIPPESIASHVSFLADDLLEGRRTGTRGYDLGAAYVASRFLEAGLEPTGDNGTFLKRIHLLRSVARDTSASIAERDGSGPPALLPASEVAISGDPYGESVSVTGKAVFVGFGIDASELGWNDYEGLDVQGAVVLALAGTPPGFEADAAAVYRDESSRVEAARRRGAKALVSIYPPSAEERFPWSMLKTHIEAGHLYLADDERVGKQLAATAWISPRSAEDLMDRAGKNWTGIVRQLRDGQRVSFALPFSMSLVLDSELREVVSANVIGRVPGSDPKLGAESVVVSAHLDHVGIGEPRHGDSIYNGAYDNASGVASLIAAADAIAALQPPPKRSIVFIATTAEEEGLVGADYFARHVPESAGDVVVNINLDGNLMLFSSTDVLAVGAERAGLTTLVAREAARLGKRLGPNPFVDRVLLVRTDSFSFVKQGIPSLLLLNGITIEDSAIDGLSVIEAWERDVFHTPSDDARQPMDFHAGATHARFTALVALALANAAERPAFLPGSFLGQRFGTKRSLP